MAGGLRARVASDRRSAEVVVRFEGDTVHVRGERFFATAIELWKLRRALRRVGHVRFGIPVRLSLGRLPTLSVSL